MVKHKKKRNKAYTGSGATSTRPAVTRISAVNRSRHGQWWFEHKRMVRIVGIVAGILFGIVLIIIGLIGLLV